MKNKKLYIGVAIAIIIIIIIIIVSIMNIKNKKQNVNIETNETSGTYEIQEPTKGDGGETTDEDIENNFKLEQKDIPDDLNSKIPDAEKFYKELKKYAYQKGLVQADTLTLGQYTENETTIEAMYLLEKDGKVQQRIFATINKQDNTYTFEYYM